MNKKGVLWLAASLWAVSIAAGAGLSLLPPLAGAKARAPVAALPADGSSLYEIPLAFQSDEGRPFRFDAFRGRFVAVALLFTRCPSICPKLVTQLKAADRGLSPAARERVRYLLVSIDPAHDTEERLREYRARMSLDSERFALVRGAPNDVRALAASLGFSYENAPDALPTHSKLVTLLDPSGRIALQRADLGADPGALAAALARPSLDPGVPR
ncbi:MAG TPA: SCO family protein [Polyangiaceae bacterium]